MFAHDPETAEQTMHVFTFSRLFSQAIINIQDLTIVTTVPSFCWRKKENRYCGLPS